MEHTTRTHNTMTTIPETILSFREKTQDGHDMAWREELQQGQALLEIVPITPLISTMTPEPISTIRIAPLAPLPQQGIMDSLDGARLEPQRERILERRVSFHLKTRV